MIVDLLRHGTTGRDGYLDGRTDFPPDAKGWDQFRRQTCGGRWSLIVSSPLKRARDCAEALARETGAGLRIDPDWAEIDFGALDGLAHASISARADLRSASEAFYANPGAVDLPGGEAWASFKERVTRAVHGIASDKLDGPALVVSHAGALRAALAVACGFEFTSLWALRIAHGTRVRVEIGIGASGALWGEVLEISQP